MIRHPAYSRRPPTRCIEMDTPTHYLAPAMERRRLKSSVLASAGYHDDRTILEVAFRTGRVYYYFDVPIFHYDALLAAPSAGQYFNEYIRSHYRSELVYDPRRPTRGRR